MDVKSLILMLFVAGATADNVCTSKLETSPDECCESLPLFAEEKIFQDCGLSDMDETSPKLPSCSAFECVMKTAKLHGIDDKPNKDAFKNAMNTAPAEWKDIIEPTISTCFDMAAKNITGCPPLELTACIFTRLLKECPPAHWTVSSDCDVAKKYVQNCM